MTFDLRCCGRHDPLGTDKSNIRLSFALSGGALASYALEVFELGGAPVCTVPGTQSGTFIHWLDPALLRGRTGYRWHVRGRTPDGCEVVSGPGFFETGPDLWQGQWIGASVRDDRVLEFKRCLHIGTPIRSARLYICGLGYFTPYLNGRRLDDACFIPQVTDYAHRPDIGPVQLGLGHRITYYTYDITALLQPGENLLQARVAGGYYTCREKLGYEPQPDFSYGPACLRYEVHLLTASGEQLCYFSDPQTLVRCTNTRSLLYGGEHTDQTLPPCPWAPAQPVPAPDGRMTAPTCPDDRVQQQLQPVKSWQTPEGTVYDFGINHSGGLALTVHAAGEETLTLRFAEALCDDGRLNFETSAWHGTHLHTGETKDIYQQSSYRLLPGRHELAPQFSWYCYRYVLISHTPGLTCEPPTSLFISADAAQSGSFRCGNDLLERIDEAFVQTLRCNWHSGLLTDCPHRERLPYTGDGKLVMRSACYSFDALDFYYKWFRDILDAQTAEGLIPNSAPYFGGGGGYAWGDALCTVARLLYGFTGDMQIAREGYAAIVRWIGYCRSKADGDHIIRSNSHTWMLGDWLAPEVVQSDVYYISTVCYLQAVQAARFFAALTDPDRCAQWERLAGEIISGINRVFFDPQRCCYANGVQGENVLALAEGIVPEACRANMEAALRHHYGTHTGGHLDTGIMLTPVLLGYLTDHGHRDLAWRIMTADSYPSYRYLLSGETTLSEHWSKKWPDYYFGEPGNSRLVKGGGELSHCHPMYGSVNAWLYERVAGLDLSCLCERTVVFCPSFIGFLPWASACKPTPFGTAAISWADCGGSVTLELTVPEGLTARCRFPAFCDCLHLTQTGAQHAPAPNGYFDFTLPAGRWQLTGINKEQPPTPGDGPGNTSHTEVYT